MKILILPVVVMAVSSGGAMAVSAAPLRSGPQVGEKPLPFTSNLVTGAYRGEQHCYICDMVSQPAVLVFSRRTDRGSAHLLQRLRQAVREHQKEKLFAWFVLLAPSPKTDESHLENQAYDFARKNGVTALPVSALGDVNGPPGYQISPEAAVTFIVFRSGKVLYNHAYRAGEWNARAGDRALKELSRVIG